MKATKKVVWGLLVLALTGVILAGCSSGPPHLGRHAKGEQDAILHAAGYSGTRNGGYEEIKEYGLSTTISAIDPPKDGGTRVSYSYFKSLLPLDGKGYYPIPSAVLAIPAGEHTVVIEAGVQGALRNSGRGGSGFQVAVANTNPDVETTMVFEPGHHYLVADMIKEEAWVEVGDITTVGDAYATAGKIAAVIGNELNHQIVITDITDQVNTR
jgi:hypothetical protein